MPSSAIDPHVVKFSMILEPSSLKNMPMIAINHFPGHASVPHGWRAFCLVSVMSCSFFVVVPLVVEVVFEVLRHHPSEHV